MPQRDRAIVDPHISSSQATERNQAAIRLLTHWLREDTKVESDTWERLKAELDRDRLSDRTLFP